MLCFVRDYRRMAKMVGREQWRLVFTVGRPNKDHTPATNALNDFCGAAPVQMARYQVAEQIKGWLSNRANEFAEAVQYSTLSPDVKHQLHMLNRSGAIYRPGEFIMKGNAVPSEIRRLGRNVMRGIMARHRKPNLANISPRLDSRCAVLEPAKKADHADFWLRISVPDPASRELSSSRIKRRHVMLPVHDTDYRKARKAPFCATVQLVTSPIGLSVRVASDVTEVYAAEREAYDPARTDIALDFGLATLFASNEGDLLGRDWLKQLRSYDARLQPIARHMQKIGKKPRDSRRFRELTNDVRGFIRTEVNRVMNALVAVKRPAHLVLERLDFRHSELSARLNRMLRNCGRSVIKEKLADLEQRWGVTSEEVNPAYSSQQCASCGFVCRGNRPSQSRFVCGWCGHTAHADVNAARTLRSRRSGSPGALASPGRGALVELARRFDQRMKTQALGRRGDVLRRSAFVRRLSADQIAVISGLASCVQKQ
ncbi:MAG TPA: transposase [Xanthobacteraceae bacterium]